MANEKEKTDKKKYTARFLSDKNLLVGWPMGWLYGRRILCIFDLTPEVDIGDSRMRRLYL